MKHFLVVAITFILMLPQDSWGTVQKIEQDYARSVQVLKPIQVAYRSMRKTLVAGIDLAEYDYAAVFQYVIASQTATLFALGITEQGELVLGALNIFKKDLFRPIVTLPPKDRMHIRFQDIKFALCYLNHPFTYERLRYVFLTYPDSGGNDWLRVYRMENDDTLTFHQVVSANIAEDDAVYVSEDESPYTYVKRRTFEDKTFTEPGTRVIPRIMMADVNHDEFMDIVIWRKVYVARSRDALPSPLEEKGLQGFTLNREEIQVMFFDWETISFSEPLAMPTQSLGGDLLWQMLFPSHRKQEYDAWKEVPTDSPEQ